MLKALLFGLTLLLASCSSTQKKQPEKKIVEQKPKKEVSKKLSFEDFQKDIEKRLSEAKREGETSVYKLSNEIFFKAMDASMRGESKVSTFLYKKLYELNPKDNFIASKYAVELIRSGESKISVAIIEKIFNESKGKDFKIGLLLAGIYTSFGKNNKAIDIYEKILTHQKDEEACLFLVQTYRIEKKFKKALNTISKCEKNFPESPLFEYQKGRVAISQGKLRKGQFHFEKSLSKDPTFSRAALSLGIIQETDGKYENAIKTYENFLDQSPDNYKVLSRLVKVLFMVEDYKRLLPYVERLSSLDQEDLNLKVRLGILYTDAKKYDEAIGVFNEILKNVPDSDKVLYYLGSLHQQKGNDKEAINYFSKIPDSSTLYVESNLAIAKVLNKKALEKNDYYPELKRFIASKSEKSEELQLELNVILANHYESKNSFKKAISTLMSLKKNKLYQEGHDYYLASLLEKDNRYPEAKTIIEDILAKNPENPHALNFLGYTMLEIGEELDLAYKYIKKAVALRPNDGYIRDSLGWYYYKTGNLKRPSKKLKRPGSLLKMMLSSQSILPLCIKK